ncbi:hypothetical protein PC121_g13894 [Phytophthora cactorum]|nr:hypothetical protein PC121_g13894 [Phytophthora cactorum]
MNDQRFILNPFGELTLSAEDRARLVEITDEIIMAKFEEYEEHLNIGKIVDLKRWKKFSKSGPTTSYLERKSSSPNTKLPQLLMVGPLPGTLDENMFGIVNPTIESMRIKSSYLSDFNAAAVLATVVEPTVDDPFRSVVVKWMEIDIPLASIGLVRNRDYVYVESTGILHLQNGERVGYHLFHSVSFPEVHELPNRVRGNMSFCGIFHQEGPDRTDCRGTGIMDPGGDMIRAMAVMGMVQATMAGLKYSYCGQMKKLAWLLEQKQGEAREKGTPAFKPFCVTCMKGVKASKLGCTAKSEGSWLVEAAGEDTVWNSVRWVFCYASWSIHAHTLTAPFPSATPTPFSFHRTSNAVAQRPTSFSDSQGKTIFPSSQLAALTVELLSTLAT